MKDYTQTKRIKRGVQSLNDNQIEWNEKEHLIKNRSENNDRYESKKKEGKSEKKDELKKKNKNNRVEITKIHYYLMII